MSKIKGTNIAAPIVPYATSDNYPTHYAKYGKGGYVSLPTIEDRDSIPEERLEEGMLVYILEDEQSYQYLGGEWVAAKVGKEDSLRFEGSKDYNARVENGTVVAYNEIPTYRLPMPIKKGAYDCIKINSFYLGYESDNNAHNFLPCSHRFIELANIGSSRISLKGLFIKIYYGGVWETLELSGIIEPGSTYLIRGEQTSVMETETTKIKIKQYNQSWDSSSVNARLGVMFYLCWGNEEGQVLDKNGEFIDYPSTREDILDSYSYVDCVSTSDTSITGNGIQRKNQNASLENIVFLRKCPLDPCYIDTKDNTKDWRYHFINDSRYQPGASYEGKDLSWGNDWLGDGSKPITLTCTVGRIAAKQDRFDRNFTWTTLNSEHDTLFIRRASDGSTVYPWSSFKGIFDKTGDAIRALDDAEQSAVINGPFEINRKVFINEESGNPIPEYLLDYYNRSRWETFTGEVVYTYRALISITADGIFEYCCGKADSNGNPIPESVTETKYIHTKFFPWDDGVNLGYLQIGNYNISTYDDAILLKQSSEALLSSYKYTARTNLSSLKADFIVNTGNLVKHGTRPEEWIYYIRNNKLLNYYAEFITPGENDLGEINLYDIGEKKLNPRMFDKFYTFEYGHENLPSLKRYGVDGIMPGLYSTNYLGHIIISYNSTPITFPKDPEIESTTWSVLGVLDSVADLPSVNEKIGIPSQYYKDGLVWLFRELYYYWDKKKYYEELPDQEDWGSEIDKDLFRCPGFVTDTIPDSIAYLPDFVTILTNRAPIEPYTDMLYNRRKEGDQETTRAADYVVTDNLNYHLNYLVSRYFKLWQIKAVLSNNDWGIGGLTKRIHDAGTNYAPPVINTDFRNVLIEEPLEAFDTFQPVIIEEDMSIATDLVKSQEVRYIWNGSGNTWPIEFDGGGYTNIDPGDSRAYHSWDGRYSVLLANKLNTQEDRDNMKAPRYVILDSSLNQFELYNKNTDETYDSSCGEMMRPLFEKKLYSVDGLSSNLPQCPDMILHEFPFSRYAISHAGSEFLENGGRTITFKGANIKTGDVNITSYKDWNTEEEMFNLSLDDNPMEYIHFTKSITNLLGPLNF